MKKLLFGLGLVFCAALSQASSNGTMLDSVIVEKYHTATSTDHTSDANLAVGAVTYRIYVDMKTGYKLQSVYGSLTHHLIFSTTTNFYNSPAGATDATGIAKTASGADLYDSWVSVGAVNAYYMGEVLTENAAGYNSGASSKTAPGITETPTLDLSAFDGSTVASLFNDSTDAYSSLSGAVGPTTTNRVLIGQFTTTGNFHYELNFQLGDASGNSEVYVATGTITALTDGRGGEYTNTYMMGTMSPNVAPTCALVHPNADTTILVKTGSSVTLAATATDLLGSNMSTGSVASVKFYDGANLLSSVTTAPYTYSWSVASVTAGAHTVTAVATDNEGAMTTATASRIITIDKYPTATLTASKTTINAGESVVLSTSATSTNSPVGTLSYAYSGGITASTATVSVTPTATGSYSVTVSDATVAHDTVSAKSATITVVALPTITSVEVVGTKAIGSVDSIEVNFSSNTASVSLYDGGTLIKKYNKSDFATDLKAAPTADVWDEKNNTAYFIWTVTNGSHTFTAIAYNSNNGGTQMSTTTTGTTGTSFTVGTPDVNTQTQTHADSTSAYAVLNVTRACNSADTVAIPVVKNQLTAAGIIGYDIQMTYDPMKLKPTGQIIKGDASIVNPLSTQYTANVDDGNLSIAYALNGLNGDTAFNNVKGTLLYVVFQKTANYMTGDNVILTASLIESYPDHTSSQAVGNGSFTTVVNQNFAGSLFYYADGKAMTYDGSDLETYILGTSSKDSVDSKGTFTYNAGTNGGTITISRNIATTTDVMPVINGHDAYLASLVAVASPTFTPTVYQIIAMDVNQDGMISAGDVSQINMRTTGLISGYTQVGRTLATAKSWVFVDMDAVATQAQYQQSTVYPNSDGIGFSKYMVPSVPDSYNIAPTGSCPSTNTLTYTGIMLGDADGNYKNLSPLDEANYNKLKSDVVSNDTATYSDKVIFNLESNGKYVDVPVFAQSNVTVNSLDFAFKFNDKSLKFVSVSNIASVNALSKVGQDSIRFTSYSLNNYATDSAIATIRFEKQDSVVASDISSVSGYINGSHVGSSVVSGKPASSTSTSSLIGNVYPNPTRGTISVIVTQNSSIAMYDALGRVVATVANAVAGQITTIDLSTLTTGVYTLKVSNDTTSSYTKVVKQ